MRKIILLSLLSISASFLFSQINLELQSQVTYEQNLSDIWGYTDEAGNEYALVCLRAGTAIENITDPTNPQRVSIIEGPASTWRDAKTFGKYAYLINESSKGLQVINLEKLPNALDSTDTYFWEPMIPGLGQLASCHNIYIDTESGYGFLAGCNINSGGIIIIDLFTNPGNPIFVAAAAPIYAHDVYVRDNLIYSSDIFEGGFAIQDISDLNNITTINSQVTPFAFTHNAWLSDDSKVIFTTDERGNAPVAAYDISDMTDIKFLDEFRPLESIDEGLIPHNVHVIDDFLVTSFYTEGVIITDAKRPQNLIEVGNFDTYLGGNGNFNGVWGAYPFFESGTIIASDIGSGLFVLKPTYVRACYLEGSVTDSLTGGVLDGVEVSILSEDPNTATSNLTGAYKTGQVSPGFFEVTFSKPGYFPKTVTASLENGVLTIMDVALTPDPDFSTSIQLLSGVEELVAYPNPFSKNMILQYKLTNLPPGTRLVVNDLVGRTIKIQEINQKEGYLELGDNWQPGVYFLQLEAKGAISQPLKVMKGY